jgi:hypothetical protein
VERLNHRRGGRKYLNGGTWFVASRADSSWEGAAGAETTRIVMDDQTPETVQMAPAEIDDRFFGDWFEFGMRELGAYLGRHAQFARYLQQRDGLAGA